MLGKILIVIGLLLLIVGAVLYVCSMPIFTFTRTETHIINLPPLQKSESVMNYAFDLLGYAKEKEVQVQITTTQTLNILATGNNGFYFKIVKHQPDGIDAIFLSLGRSASINQKWTPAQSDSYSLIFYKTDWTLSQYVTISANVNKTWTVAQTRTDTEAITEQKPFINLGLTQRDDYLFIGVSALGCVVFIVGGYANYKASPKRSAQKS